MTIKHLYPAVEPSLNLDFANSKKLDSRITFTRASTGTYLDPETQLIKTAAANEARIEKEGLLIEESGTNRVVNSTSVTATGGTVTLNGGSSPDGGTASILLTANQTGGYVQGNSGFGVSTVTDHTISFWYKDGTGTATSIRIEGILNGGGRAYFSFLDLNDGTNVSKYSTHTNSYGIQIFPNGWKRFYMGYNSASGTNATGSFVFKIRINGIQNTQTCYLFGLQAETGSFPTSYIPTSGSTVTRSTDVASMTGTNFSSWYNQDQGTFTLKTSAIRSGATGILLGGISGAGYGEVEIARANNEVWFVDYLTSPFRKIIHDVSVGENRISGSYDNQTAQAIAVNGTVSTTSQSFTTNANIITGISLMRRNPQAYECNGHIASLTYYPYRLTDAQLEALTL